MIDNKVKLIVWDLDETFWRGTLSEEGIVPIERHGEMLIELARRGILNSISSKNDHEQAKSKLVELGVWEYFVFPSISFSPKGKAIGAMIEAASLRAENVLFIDDNRSNLEEVKFHNPGIMTAHPDEVLEGLLDHPNLAGKPDPEMTRLKQYKFLQQKVEERNSSTLSNDEFLRSSNIRVTIDHDIEANFDRVVELINRTNQLNYTKKRLETPEDIAGFREMLKEYSYFSGCVFAQDNYGDYGLIGFFLMKKKAAYRDLIHFVFSCRTMHMGIEQYVYEMLERPEVEIRQPVSYGLNEHAAIDWINAGGDNSATAMKKVGKLLLLGGCDLLQLASYCSANRVEFVNRVDGDYKVRYDDPGFIAGDRKAIEKYADLIPYWTLKDAVEFDEAAASADLIILCLWSAMQGHYFDIGGEVQFRLTARWKRFTERKNLRGFLENVKEIDLDPQQRLDLIRKSFDAVGRLSQSSARIILIGATGESRNGQREIFNANCAEYCVSRPKFHFVDVNALLPKSLVAKDRKWHYEPAGYFQLARHILDVCGEPIGAVETQSARESNGDEILNRRKAASAV